jgi:hypothetical protein
MSWNKPVFKGFSVVSRCRNVSRRLFPALRWGRAVVNVWVKLQACCLLYWIGTKSEVTGTLHTPHWQEIRVRPQTKNVPFTQTRVRKSVTLPVDDLWVYVPRSKCVLRLFSCLQEQGFQSNTHVIWRSTHNGWPVSLTPWAPKKGLSRVYHSHLSAPADSALLIPKTAALRTDSYGLDTVLPRGLRRYFRNVGTQQKYYLLIICRREKLKI